MSRGRHLIIGTQSEKAATAAELGEVNDSARSSKNDWVPRPRERSECFRDREIGEACPFVGCRHHYAIDVYSSGAPRINAEFIDRPWNCSLDFVDTNPNGATLVKIGDQFGLTKERIRQIEDLALAKIVASGPEAMKELASHLHLSSEAKKRMRDLYRIDLSDYRSEVTTTCPEEDDDMKSITKLTSRLKKGAAPPEPKVREVPILTDDEDDEIVEEPAPKPKTKTKSNRVPLAEFVEESEEEEETVVVPKKPKKTSAMRERLAARKKAAAEAHAAAVAADEPEEDVEPEKADEPEEEKPKPKRGRPKKVVVEKADEPEEDVEPEEEKPKPKRGRPKKVAEKKPRAKVKRAAKSDEEKPAPKPRKKREPKPRGEKKARAKKINPRRFRLNRWEEAIAAVIQDADGGAMSQKEIVEDIGDFVKENNGPEDHYSVVRNSVRRLIALGWLKRGPKGVVMVSNAAKKVFSETGGKNFASKTKTKDLSDEFIESLALDEEEVASIKEWLAGKAEVEMYLAAAMCRRLGTDLDALTVG